MLTLNPTGSIIWQQLSEGRSREEIAIWLSTQFGISSEEALTDVNEFVQRLEEHHLVLECEAQESGQKRVPYLAGLFCKLWGHEVR